MSTDRPQKDRGHRGIWTASDRTWCVVVIWLSVLVIVLSAM